MRAGLSSLSILKAFHPAAGQEFTHNANLREVCRKFQDSAAVGSSQDVALPSLQLFQPFRPMLCKRHDFDQTVDDLHRANEDGGFWIEEKIDGERIQIHKRGDEYRYWSRKGVDWTAKYGASPLFGSFTPDLHRHLTTNAKQFVLGKYAALQNPFLVLFWMVNLLHSTSSTILFFHLRHYQQLELVQ